MFRITKKKKKRNLPTHLYVCPRARLDLSSMGAVLLHVRRTKNKKRFIMDVLMDNVCAYINIGFFFEHEQKERDM